MDKQYLLSQFRLGFRQVKDKETGKVYSATGFLEKKINRLNIYGLAMVVVNPALLFANQIGSLTNRLLALVAYFVFMAFIFVWVGKKIIHEADLKDIIEKPSKH